MPPGTNSTSCQYRPIGGKISTLANLSLVILILVRIRANPAVLRRTSIVEVRPGTVFTVYFLSFLVGSAFRCAGGVGVPASAV